MDNPRLMGSVLSTVWMMITPLTCGNKQNVTRVVRLKLVKLNAGMANEPFILIAAASDERGNALAKALKGTGHETMVLSDVEALLYHTRGSVPLALVIERGLIAKVPQLDLIFAAAPPQAAGDYAATVFRTEASCSACSNPRVWRRYLFRITYPTRYYSGQFETSVATPPS